MQTTTTECTVWANGYLVLRADRRRCEELWQAIYAILSPGEVVSLRGADDMTLRKASHDRITGMVDWV